VRSIKDALAASGIDVWYDENELDGGDAWDQKIRRQIRGCDYFMPIISATTEARAEGYFRREWRLAVERTLDMADDHTFLLPVVIDDTREAGARVPEKFVAVQWLKAPGGRSTPALEALCRRIMARKQPIPPPPERAPDQRTSRPSMTAPGTFPEIPREEPGQRIRFGVQILRWVLLCAGVLFKRLPKWVRGIVYIWVLIVALARLGQWVGEGSHHDRRSADLSPANAQKLKVIADQFQGASKPADLARLGKQIAQEFADDADENNDDAPLLTIPFSTVSADPVAEKLANSTFAQVYGRLAISHQGKVALSKETLPNFSPDAVSARGKATHATYVLSGTIDTQASVQVLTVEIATAADGSIVWSKSYPVTGADPATIAEEVDSKVPSLAD
jgi:TolB-like protein